MTLKRLSQVYYLQQEIDELNEKIAIAESQAEKVTTSFSNISASSGISDKVGTSVAKIADYCNELKEKQKQHDEEKIKISEYINTIDDLQTKLIFTYRFVKLLTWKEVALKIGGNNTADSVKKKAYRYLNKKF